MHAGAGEVEAGGGRQGVVGDEQVDHAEGRDLDAHVGHEGGVVGDQDDLTSGADHGLLDGDLGDGVVRETEVEGDAADHQEELIGAQIAERHLGSGADQGLRAGAQGAAGGDEDDAGLAVEGLERLHGIGDDGDVAGAFQFLREHTRQRAAVDEQNVAGLNQGGGLASDLAAAQGNLISDALVGIDDMQVHTVALGVLAHQPGQVLVPFMLGEGDDHADILWAVFGFDLLPGQVLRQIERLVHR